MRLGEARTIAAESVARHARGDAAFWGAFFSGSTISLPPESELPPTSDVDVVVLTSANETPPKPGKFRYRDVLGRLAAAGWVRARRLAASATPRPPCPQRRQANGQPSASARPSFA
jgi:hypothetical protein